MFFRRKGRLRAKFDEQLMKQLRDSKQSVNRHKDLLEKSVDPFGEMEIQTEIAKAKYYFLLLEAKKRQITIKIHTLIPIALQVKTNTFLVFFVQTLHKLVQMTRGELGIGTNCRSCYTRIHYFNATFYGESIKTY